MSGKLILILLLIINLSAGQENGTDYSYDDYEEIPEAPVSTENKTSTSVITNEVFDELEDEERVKIEQELIKEQLDTMSTTFKTIINKIKLKHKKVDMIFLVDSSSSVGKENFENEISFVKRLLSDFNVSFNYTRVALITFSSRSKIYVHINQISEVSEKNDKCVLLNYQIPNITYSGGGTNTYGALAKAKEIFDNSKRKHSKKIVVLITDGFSNGRNPKSIAVEIKSSNISIFTMGISSGNLDELRAISSKPVENYNYMLQSFSLFESLARKALHTDYKVGVILPVSNSSFCDHLCDKNGTAGSCCATNSQCSCGFHSGHYSCVCNPGYYGSGLRGAGGCDLCPNQTYWNFWNSCLSCPDINHETQRSPAMSVNDCVCKSGFRQTQKHRCEVIKCPLLPTPDNGYFVSSSCPNTVNSACGARCKSGYQLVGSSIRLCQEDGTWSGDETLCVLKTCPPAQIPYYGAAVCKNVDLNLTIDYSPRNESFLIDYHPDKIKFTEEFPIDTECVFSCALGFHLTGSKKRHCLPVSKWDGLQTSCKQILCPALPKVPYGTYNQDECFEQKSQIGTNCTFTCNEGFELKGPSNKTCEPGKSSNSRNGVWTQKSKIPRCIDVMPPLIVCPLNYSIEINSSKNYIILAEFHQLLQIEDNSDSNVTFWVKPALKEEGTKMYAGNYTFTYVAIDDSKNKAKCNFSISIADTTPPSFENCIANQTFYSSGLNKSLIKIEWEEPYAFDIVDDKNLTILKSLDFGPLGIGAHLANYTAIDQSGNKNSCLITITVKEKKCTEFPKPENGQRVCAKNETMTWCDFRCDFGYGLLENETIVENIVLYCDNDVRVWSKESAPECAVIEQPNSVEEVLTISLNSENLQCDEYAKNQDTLIKELKDELCGNQECELTTELPECVEDPSVNDTLSSTFYTLVKRDTNSKPVKKLKNPEKVELYIKVSKNLGMWRPNSTRSENIRRVKEELKKVNSSERFKKRLRNMNLDLTALKLDEHVKCNTGSVSRKLVCVQCSKGTYHDQAQNLCIPCAIGSFNNQTSQTSCNKCPQYYSTRKQGSRSETECRPMCGPGTFARIKKPKKSNIQMTLKTLMPFCGSCSMGEYQPHYDQTQCLKCPPGMTSERGSKSIEDCIDKFENSCDSTTCGDHGKCVQNDAFYSCECDPGYYGQNCEITENPCLPSPCFNDGVCKIINETIPICECQSPFQGTYCEQTFDPCSAKNCQNGGNCYEIGDEGFCECLPGFQGDTCEEHVQIDFCASSPCVNSTCVNLQDDYKCICEEGLIGKRCHLQPCDYGPCPQNSVCINLKFLKATRESYTCKCFTGLKGKNCNEVDDPCTVNPCHNDAKCVPKLLRDPNNTTLYENGDIFKEYTCSCPPYFYGDRCEVFTTPDFILEFEKSSVNNYVKFDGPQSGLAAFSFCSWIQTNDNFNYGSIISYANKDSDNAFTFTDYNGFVLYINGVNIITDIKIIDNIWHFLCVSWTMDEGFYEIYLDGSLHVSGYNLSRNTVIEGKGIFIVGQEQDSIGGSFSETESFVGKISYLDFWDRQLTASEVSEYYRSCDPYQGSFTSWTDLKMKIHGNVKVDKSEFCKPCEKNLEIDNADIIYGDQSAFVKCSLGFKLEGNPFLFCLRTSKWDLSRLPACKIVKCSPVKTPSNGRLLISKISYRGVANFKCDDGFELEGSESIFCTEKGTWSDEIPQCKSIFECPALDPPGNGQLIYANDDGIIRENLTSYSLGTFIEIKCNEGFSTEQENLISCMDNGEWDFEVEDCQADVVDDVVDVSPPKEFLKQFKNLIFESCKENKPELCKFYKIKDFDSSIASFELPDSSDYEGMDVKLYDLLKKIENQNDLNPQNFLRTLLRNNIMIDKTRLESYRFVICLYIDLIILDEEIGITLSDEMDDNINDNIKRLLKKVMKNVYANHVKNL